MAGFGSSVPIEKVEVSAYRIPTDFPESDGSYEWDETTLVVAEATAGGIRGLGYSYADAATAQLIKDHLADRVKDLDAMAIQGAWTAMVHSIRNLGRPGIASMAISAVDVALWDLKARLLELPLAKLLGMVRDAVPIYGSGGFTSYSDQQLAQQLGGWVAQGIPRVKMKIGRDVTADRRRVHVARNAVGPDAQLFVDADGGYSRKQALDQAEYFAQLGVTWFEEPVSSDDLEGLHLMRDRAPAGMDVAAGEYGCDQFYFRRMLEAQAVDVLQADATRCAGITGWLRAGALCEAHSLPFSAHAAPSIHLHPCCAVSAPCNLEYSHDHVRIEKMLFDGAVSPVNGALHPDLSRPGLGLDLKRSEAARFAI